MYLIVFIFFPLPTHHYAANFPSFFFQLSLLSSLSSTILLLCWSTVLGMGHYWDYVAYTKGHNTEETQLSPHHVFLSPFSAYIK